MSSLKSTAQSQPLFELIEQMPEEPITKEEKPVHIDSENILEVGELPFMPSTSESLGEINVEQPEEGILEVELKLDPVPGAPNATDVLEVPEKQLEVSEEDEKENKVDDANDAKSKKNEKWDWAKRGPHGFVAWIKERFESVPKHSGQDTAGLERAQSYLEKLDNEISKAMRLDLDGELDADKVEEIRAQIDEGIARLQERLEKVKKVKRHKRKKTSETDLSNTITKEAQKILGVKGVYITVPLLISAIARVCINGTVSAGHDIEELFDKQAKKYKLNDREKAEVVMLLSDMGYPLRRDRGFMIDEDCDMTSSDNCDWAANYRS